MATDRDDGRLRLYLLGGLPEEECTALEEEYFLREETLDRLWAAEYELVDDYLAERLTPDERARFDQHYLATPVHRHRVAVARQLRLEPARQEIVTEAPPARTSLVAIVRSLFDQPWPLKVAFAALLLVMAIGGAWLVRARLATRSVAPATSTALPSQPPRSETPAPNVPQQSPVVLAIALSPAGVRSAEDSPRVTIPAGTDQVVIHLESDGPPHLFTKARAVVHTVSGREVWRGPATAESPARAPVFARIEVPADRLAPDDYLVTLLEIHDSGPEIEGFRYFLRIRAR